MSGAVVEAQYVLVYCFLWTVLSCHSRKCKLHFHCHDLLGDVKLISVVWCSSDEQHDLSATVTCTSNPCVAEESAE